MEPLSPAKLQVMWNRLLAVVEEQGQTLIRAAFSPIVRESGDISAGIFNVRGQMLAQAVTGTPGHINTMAEAVLSLKELFPIQNMKPGDIYMTNDPWMASGHLNDFLLMMPVFKDQRVVAFTSCTSHLVDLGGLGMGPEGADIFEEGLLLPPCTLVEQGELNSLLLDIVKINSREPLANEGDIYALVACCESGARLLIRMMNDFKLDDLEDLSEYIIEKSRVGTLEAIAEVPDGVYRNVMTMDGFEKEIELHATLSINGTDLQVDFDGTSGCSKKGINVPLNYATAYTVFALRCIIGPDIPNNAGSLGPFKVSGPPGCILNAQHPVPVAMRHTLGQMTPDLVLGCLSQAIPDSVPAEGASCLYDLPMRHAPEVARDGGRRFAVELVHSGGTGARPTSDGLSATAFPSGVYGSQVEITEAVAPITIWRRELVTDSGGAGQYRGGLGQGIEMSAANDAAFLIFLSVERINNPARGRAGGKAGMPGRIRLEGRAEDIPGKGELRIEPGEHLIFETPGGGGFGPPERRAQRQVDRDIKQELVTANCSSSEAVPVKLQPMVTPLPHIDLMTPYSLADVNDNKLTSLAQNESAFPPSPLALEAGRASLKRTSLYPDPNWQELRTAIAEVHGLDPAGILCAVGSMELIATLIRTYVGSGQHIASTDYAYAFVATVAAQMNASITRAAEPDYTVSVENLLMQVKNDTRIVFVCNPGNPTGTMIPSSELLRLRNELPGNVLLIIDQAYAEFTRDDAGAVFNLVQRDNTVVTRTFSKAYGLAGARVGWGLFPPIVSEQVRKLLNPNNVSASSQAMATMAMRDQPYMIDVVRKTVDIRNQFRDDLRALGLAVPRSYTNFVLIDFGSSDRATAAHIALINGGILMRGMSGYGLAHCLRATISGAEAMNRAIDILKEI